MFQGPPFLKVGGSFGPHFIILDLALHMISHLTKCEGDGGNWGHNLRVVSNVLVLYSDVFRRPQYHTISHFVKHSLKIMRR